MGAQASLGEEFGLASLSISVDGGSSLPDRRRGLVNVPKGVKV
jgi:hypothetical protein